MCVNHHLTLSGVNAVLDVYIESVSHNLVILKCELPCFSPGLECALVDLISTATNITLLTLIMNYTSSVSGSDTSHNYPTQLITLTNLISDTTYNFCVVGFNITDMMEVGDPVCGNFTTDSIATANKMETGIDGRHKYFFGKWYYCHC